MEQSPVMDISLNIQVRKTHIILLAVLVVGATATATVDIKDQTNIFQTLNMTGNTIQNLQNPSNPQDAATKNYVDQAGGGLDWSSVRSVAEYKQYTLGGPTSISCEFNEVLVSVSCQESEFLGADVNFMKGVKCDSRNRLGASINEVGNVMGTCVDGGQEPKTTEVNLNADEEEATVDGQYVTQIIPLDREYNDIYGVELSNNAFGAIQPVSVTSAGNNNYPFPSWPWRVDLYRTDTGTAERNIVWSYDTGERDWGQDDEGDYRPVGDADKGFKVDPVSQADAIRFRTRTPTGEPVFQYRQKEAVSLPNLDWTGQGSITIKTLPEN